jgi:hypothetical protein
MRLVKQPHCKENFRVCIDEARAAKNAYFLDMVTRQGPIGLLYRQRVTSQKHGS